MTGLTDIQQQVLDAIRTHIVEKGYPPSVRDVCDAVGLQSSSTGHHHLKALQRKGLIVRDPDVPRGLRVVGMKTGRGTGRRTYGCFGRGRGRGDGSFASGCAP